MSSAVTSCAWCCCSMATREILKSSARVAYSVLFMFSMVFAWMLRDFAKPVISRIPCTCDIMICFLVSCLFRTMAK